MSGLVISRRKGESFFIGDNIKVTLVEVRAWSVRLLVDAPRDVAVVREEMVNDTMMRMKRLASVENLKRELAKAEQKIQADESDIANLGRIHDPLGVADAYVEPTMIEHGV